MSNEVINQAPSPERAKEFELQAKEGLKQLKQGQDKVVIACHKMRDTKAYKTLGFDSYYAWGESALNLKKSRLNELAVAGEVQQELLSAVVDVEKKTPMGVAEVAEKTAPIVEDSSSETSRNVVDEKAETDILTNESASTHFQVAELSEISTPQLVALAKAPKGERLAVLDLAAVEAKAEDKPLTTSTIKEAVKASAKVDENIEISSNEQALLVKKQHKAAMTKVSKLTETLSDLDMTLINTEEVESWKAYLEEIKQSISALEKGLGH